LLIVFLLIHNVGGGSATQSLLRNRNDVKLFGGPSSRATPQTLGQKLKMEEVGSKMAH